MTLLALHIGRIVKIDTVDTEINGIPVHIVTAHEPRGNYTRYTRWDAVAKGMLIEYPKDTITMQRYDAATKKSPEWKSMSIGVEKADLPEQIAAHL